MTLGEVKICYVKTAGNGLWSGFLNKKKNMLNSIFSFIRRSLVIFILPTTIFAQITTNWSQVNHYCGEFGRALTLLEVEQQWLAGANAGFNVMLLYGGWLNDSSSTGGAGTPDGKLCFSQKPGSVFTHLVTLDGDPVPGTDRKSVV